MQTSDLITSLLKGPFAKLIRNGLTWLVGIAAAHELLLDTSSLINMVTTAVIIIVLLVWSTVVKLKPSDDTLEVIKSLAGAVAGFAVTAILGYLNSKGNAFGPETDPVTIIGALLMILSSQLHRPDAKSSKADGKYILPAWLMLGLASLAMLTSCVAAHGAADGSWTYAALGTNSAGIAMSAAGYNAATMDQTDAIAKVSAGLVKVASTKGLIGIGNNAVNAVAPLAKP